MTFTLEKKSIFVLTIIINKGNKLLTTAMMEILMNTNLHEESPIVSFLYTTWPSEKRFPCLYTIKQISQTRSRILTIGKIRKQASFLLHSSTKRNKNVQNVYTNNQL